MYKTEFAAMRIFLLHGRGGGGNQSINNEQGWLILSLFTEKKLTTNLTPTDLISHTEVGISPVSLYLFLKYHRNNENI